MDIIFGTKNVPCAILNIHLVNCAQVRGHCDKDNTNMDGKLNTFSIYGVKMYLIIYIHFKIFIRLIVIENWKYLGVFFEESGCCNSLKVFISVLWS